MLSTQQFAWVFAIVFLAVGVLGFVPGITSDGMLLGIFTVDALHNSIHLLSGVVALLAALKSAKLAKLYFQVFGVVYALVAVLGFLMDGMVLGMMMNMADHILHIVIAVVALWIGFGMKEKGMMPPSTMTPTSSSIGM